MRSIAAQILAGILLGALCYVPPVLLLSLFLPQGQGGATGFAIVGGILIAAAVLIGLTLQAATTFLLRKRGPKYVTAGIWLIYPIVAVAVVGYKFYVEYQVAIAAREDYSGREIVRPAGEIRDLLLILTENDLSGFQSPVHCFRSCIALLRSGVLDSVAKPISRSDGEFAVFRHARGEPCVVAKESGYDRGWLTKSGYLDECITRSISKTFEYDVSISFGSHLRRPNGPCCFIAEIHTLDDGEHVLLARFEEGDGRHTFGPPFTIAEILVELMGQPIETSLAPYPVETIQAELARLVAATEQRAHLRNSYDLSFWINQVFREAANRNGARGITLSGEDIENLVLIAPSEPPQLRNGFFQNLGMYMDQESIDALTAADASALP